METYANNLTSKHKALKGEVKEKEQPFLIALS
jgi:hypothetical protein